MGTETVLGFTIEVRRTDEQIKKQEAYRRSILDTINSIKKLKEATQDNIDKQKERAGTLANLEIHLQAEKQAYNEVNKEILNNNKIVTGNALSIDSLRAELALVTKAWSATTDASQRDINVTGSLAQQKRILTEQLKSLEGATGSYGRNVGNYSPAFTKYANIIRGLQGPTKILGELTGIGAQELNQFRIVVEHSLQGISTFTKAQQEAAAATKASAIATEANTVATEEAAAASYAWLGPLAAIGAAIGAAIFVIVRYKDQLFGLTEAQKDKMRADDGMIISDEKLRESYNKDIKTIRDLVVEYQVLTGRLTEHEGELIKLENKNKDALSEISKETKKKLEETGGWWGQLKLAIAGSIGLGALEVKKQMDEMGRIISDGQIAINEKDKLLLEEKKVADAKFWDEWLKDAIAIQEKVDKKREDDAKKALELAEKDLQKQFDAFVAYWDKVDAEERKRADKLAKQKLDEEIKAAEARKKRAEDMAKELDDENRAANEAFQKSLDADAERKKKADDKRAADMRKQQEQNNAELLKSAIDNVKKIEDAVFSAQEKAIERRHKQQNNALDAQNTLESKKIDDQLQKGLITQAQADQKRSFLAEQTAKKKLELDKKEFEDGKKLKIKQIEIALAVSIAEIFLKSLASAKSIATFGAAGLAEALELSAIAAGGAATEIGIIASQKFARGGIIDGPGTGTSDSIPIRVSKGEAVINAESTRMFAPILSQINQAGGGKAFSNMRVPVPYGSPNINSSKWNGITKQDLREAMAEQAAMINDKKVYVVEKEMTGAQTKAKVIDSANKF